jgi:hypothetical protein
MEEESPETPETPETPKPDKASDGLQAALKAEREKRQAAEKRLAKIEADQKKAAEERQKKAGEYEALYTSYKAEVDPQLAELAELRAEKTARIEALKTSNAERLSALPEEWQEMVPDGLSPDALAGQLSKIEKRLGAEQERPGGPPRIRPPKKERAHIPAEHKEQVEKEAHKYGLDPLQYWTRHYKPRLERQKKGK